MSALAAITKYCDWVAEITTTTTTKTMKFKISVPTGPVNIWWGSASWFANSCLLAVSSHKASTEARSEVPCVSSYKGTDSIMRVPA
jgi:hypothetical protein